MKKETSQYTEESDLFVFPKWVNKVPRLILLGLISVVAGIIFSFWYWASPKNTDVGYAPKQPIPYSHRLHVGELGLDCRYCHTQVDKGAHATIPPTETCMNCHKTIKTDSPHIQKIHESFATNTPIEWIKVHDLPDFAYFNHSRHVNSGVSCVSCHGRVDQMEVVRQEKPLSMSWCLECHRAPEQNLRPKDKVTDLGWVNSEDPLEMGRRLKEKYNISPREDCSTCHR